MENNSRFVKLRNAEKYSKNPFLTDEILKIDSGKKMIIAGSTKQVLVDTDSGQIDGITLLHKYKEVDRTQFVKLYVNEIQSLFDLSKTGLKVFGFVVNSMRINTDEIYISITKLMQYCGYRNKTQVYKGLAELIGNKIIAMSEDTNLWYVNPNVVFNGDRIAFVKEYRLKGSPIISQTQLFNDAKEKANSNS
ncbi:MAG TPA: hypothetical protein PK431_16980 [Chitinophagales bacterium]|nr:hypothetical protein [Chitinophagales bacterium]